VPILRFSGSGPLAFNNLYRLRKPASAFDPGGKRQQRRPTLRILGKHQQLGPPVTGMCRIFSGGQQMLTHLLQVVGPGAVGPSGRTGGTFEILVDSNQQGNGRRPALKVDGQHGAHR
jgi:hypothetical protein